MLMLLDVADWDGSVTQSGKVASIGCRPVEGFNVTVTRESGSNPSNASDSRFRDNSRQSRYFWRSIESWTVPIWHFLTGITPQKSSQKRFFQKFQPFCHNDRKRDNDDRTKNDRFFYVLAVVTWFLNLSSSYLVWHRRCSSQLVPLIPSVSYILSCCLWFQILHILCTLWCPAGFRLGAFAVHHVHYTSE